MVVGCFWDMGDAVTSPSLRKEGPEVLGPEPGAKWGRPHAMAMPLIPQTHLKSGTASSTLGVRGSECRGLIHCHTLIRAGDDRSAVFLSFQEHLDKEEAGS